MPSEVTPYGHGALDETGPAEMMAETRISRE